MVLKIAENQNLVRKIEIGPKIEWSATDSNQALWRWKNMDKRFLSEIKKRSGNI